MGWEEIVHGMHFIPARSQLIITILEETIGVEVTTTTMVLGEPPPITTGEISQIPVIIQHGTLILIVGEITTITIAGEIAIAIATVGEQTITTLILGEQIIITGPILILPATIHGEIITTIAGGQEVLVE